MTDVPIDGVIEFPTHHQIMVSNEMWPLVVRALHARDLVCTRVPDLPADRPVHLVVPAYQPGELTNPEAPGGCCEALAAITMLVMRTVDRELADHEWIQNEQGWQARVNRVTNELAALYQAIGETFLHDDPEEPSSRPRLVVSTDGGVNIETPSD